MVASIRPRRSMLYMPGSNSRALEKGRSLACDSLILDLEDAVAPDAKAEARSNIAQAVSAGGYGGREILVRINGLDTPWGAEDIAMLAALPAGSSLDGVLIPKVNDAQDIARFCQNWLSHNSNLPAIWCMVETPLAILNIREIASASPHLAGLVMGTSDLAKDLHCLHTPERLPFIASLNLAVLAARAYGLAVIDGVYLDLADDAGFAAACQQGLALGFDGKSLIHPKTIAVTNQAFGPSASEIADCQRIIDAFTLAQQQGKGVVVLDGRLIENLHVENAKRILTLAQKITQLEAAQSA